jgi:hypothetical protein
VPRKGSGWRRILDLPPIDWALLAAERANKGRRHTPKTIAKIKAARAKHEKARTKFAGRKAIENYKPVRQTRNGTVNALGRLLAAMASGEWFGRADIQNLSGLKRGTVAGTIIVAERRGLIERAKNPAWERQGGVECEFLYRRLALDQQVTDDIGNQGQRGDAAEGH